MRKVGDIVTIRSREWYDRNSQGVNCLKCGGLYFPRSMAEYCGEKAKITMIDYSGNAYRLNDMPFWWNDLMFEDEDTSKKAAIAANQQTPFASNEECRRLQEVINRSRDSVIKEGIKRATDAMLNSLYGQLNRGMTKMILGTTGDRQSARISLTSIDNPLIIKKLDV